MKRNDRIVFQWKLANGEKRTLAVTGEYFKEYAIELMEHEQLDKVFDVHYTVNGVTEKLDYFNTL